MTAPPQLKLPRRMSGTGDKSPVTRQRGGAVSLGSTPTAASPPPMPKQEAADFATQRTTLPASPEPEVAAFNPHRRRSPLSHDLLLSTQERMATALIFPAFFSHYLAHDVAEEIEFATNKWSRVFLAPLSASLNILLVPFAVTAGLVSFVAMIVFMLMRDRTAHDSIERESWDRALRIALFGSFISPLVTFTSAFTGLVDPTFSVTERLFRGFPEDLKI